MVQVGAHFGYHEPVDENPEPSWLDLIRSAAKEFADSVSESSRELATATEKFTVESLRAINAASTRADESSARSSAMSDAAGKAAEEARGATEGLQRSIDEARQSAEQAAACVSQVQDVAERVKLDLQRSAEELLARIEQASGTSQATLATARSGTMEAREATARVQHSVSAVEEAAAKAQRAAEAAGEAAERSEQIAGTVNLAVATAQEAAESSRQAASLAEQAGSQPAFGGEANLLLERLETDYELLTQLVQELHVRITNLSAIEAQVGTVAAPPPSEQRPTGSDNMEEAAAASTNGPGQVSAGESAAAAPAHVETPDWQEAPSAPPAEVVSEWQPETPGGWQPQTRSGWQPETRPGEETLREADPQEPAAPADPWSATPSAAFGTPEGYSQEPPEESAPASPSQQRTSEPVADTGEPAVGEPAVTDKPPRAASESEARPEVTAWKAADPEVTVSGRVQLSISPVPDFDRLLGLDGALSRIEQVQSVTLADYAAEEVTFRVELQTPASASELVRRLSEAAGVQAALTDASERTLSIRIS